MVSFFLYVVGHLSAEFKIRARQIVPEIRP